MSTITYTAILYDGELWKRDENEDAIGAAAFLEVAGMRQRTVYDARYGSRIVLRSPDGDRINVGDTMVFDGDRYVETLSGDRRDKPAPKPAKAATTKKRSSKPKKKSA